MKINFMGLYRIWKCHEIIFMGYEISMKIKIIGFNKPMILISWDFHGDLSRQCTCIACDIGAVAAASILNPHKRDCSSAEQAKLLEPSSLSLAGGVVNHLWYCVFGHPNLKYTAEQLLEKRKKSSSLWMLREFSL